MSLFIPNNNLWSPFPSFPIFGGQLISHSIYTLIDSLGEEKLPHSLNIYFLRPGDLTVRVEYEIFPIKHGKTLSVYQITGKQDSRTIFILHTSLTVKDKCNEKFQCPTIKLYEDTYTPMEEFLSKAPTKSLNILNEEIDISFGESNINIRQIKFISKVTINDKKEFISFVSFISDFFLIETALIPIDLSIFDERIEIITSIDHKIFYHSYEIECELYLIAKCSYIGDSKVICSGTILNRDNIIIATIIQEGLLRTKD